MKTSTQQHRYFRNAICAQWAQEAYRDAMRASVDFEFSRQQDEEFYTDLSARAPVPSADGWQGLGA